ncbi:MAG TPA: fatty acid--CoA ligase family protein [Devosiaceae bacterium]|nr:fatty acid--CoA ligase family protein [Devosiaceae bacterium]
MQLAKQVIFQARLREDEPAVATTTAIASYRVLAKSVEAAVTRLAEFGLDNASMVIIDVAHPLHHLYLILGLSLLGVPSASLSGNGGPLPDAGPQPNLVLTDAERSDLGSIRATKIDASFFASNPQPPVDYAKLLSLPDLRLDQVLRYVFSSGTTGRRKCVAHTVERIGRTVSGNVAISSGRHGRNSAAISLMDFSTSPGNLTPYQVLSQGGLMCLAQTSAATADLIRLFGVESLKASIGQLRPLLEYLRGRAPLSSLRSIQVTGARMPLRLLAEIRAKLCPDVTFFYGSTEMEAVAVGTGGVLEREEGCVGYVLPGVALEVVDDADRPVAAGQAGKVRVRPQRQPFYVGRAGERIAALRDDGWFYPGDTARLYPDGRLVILGRSGDIINRGGVIIDPEMIEEAFRRDSRIRDLAAVNMPARHGMDEVWLAIVTDAEIDLVGMRAAAASTLREATPDRIVRVGAIPRNENSKVQRFKLREQLQALLAP